MSIIITRRLMMLTSNHKMKNRLLLHFVKYFNIFRVTYKTLLPHMTNAHLNNLQISTCSQYPINNLATHSEKHPREAAAEAFLGLPRQKKWLVFVLKGLFNFFYFTTFVHCYKKTNIYFNNFSYILVFPPG